MHATPTDTLQLDPARLAARADAIRGRTADMAATRDALASSVEALLSTWHGEAAARFAGLWTQWLRGADEVIDRLGLSADVVQSIGRDVAHADAHVRSSHLDLAGRLG